jgi:muramidase (phage lysozyme)
MGGGSNKFLGGSFDSQRSQKATPGSMGALLDIIGKGESGGNYNALVGGKKGGPKVAGSADLTNMTIAQVQEMQKGMIGQGHASTAVGKYQMISDTLAAQVKKSGLDPNTTKFDQKTQDLLASQLVNQAGYGSKDSSAVMKNLAGTWASLPKDMSGRGAYDGFNGNQAGIKPGELMAAISGATSNYQASLTGVKPETSGPTSSYQSSLTGVKPEASPAQSATTQTTATTQTDHNEKMTGLLLSMNDQLAQLNKVNRNQLDVQQKTLQRQP